MFECSKKIPCCTVSSLFNLKMSAVSQAIKNTIIELQRLPSFSEFSLAGGTNLALQYNHRISDDIDLFCPGIIGLAGWKQMQQEVQAYFGTNAKSFDTPCDINDQFSFLRFFIAIEDGLIKVEALQNMKQLYESKTIHHIKMFDKMDIGLYKLVSVSNRTTKKDIYDLDFITDDIPLITLHEKLQEKLAVFNKEEDKTIFDLDRQSSVIQNLEALIKFDDTMSLSKFPSHRHDTIKIMEGSKSWLEAKISWKSKVRKLYQQLGVDFPKPKGRNI